jgi:predicted helicase
MRKTLEFEELKDNWQLFENLVADYFREVKEDKSIETIEVDPSGEGPDGGRDILLTFRFADSISTFKRKWVVQCKFYTNSVQKKELSTINIPSLIHEYRADGYLLVCKNDVGAQVRQMFKQLNDNCRFSYDYKI